MTNEKLIQEMEQYLESLPNHDKNEGYDTERGFAGDELMNFIAHLQNKGFKLRDIKVTE